MTTATENTLLGRPIKGNISYYNSDLAKEQRPIEELVAKLDALLAFPEIEAVRWRQYTPYFNDGDPCNFGIYTGYAKIVGHEEGGDYEDGFHDMELSYPDGYWSTHNYYGVQSPDKLPSDKNDQVWNIYGSDFKASPELTKAVREFNTALTDGTHYVTLNRVFGDPAEVTATREGFSVEFYDHD